jgi:hypothetical protein
MPRTSTRTTTTACAAAALALLAAGCTGPEPAQVRAPTVSRPAPVTTEASLALPADLCAALDPAMAAAVVPDLEALEPRALRTDPAQDDTGCRTTGGDASLSVTLTQYRLALTSAEQVAADWFRAGCANGRARVLADGLGSRSCEATSVETRGGAEPSTAHGGVVLARVGTVVVEVGVDGAAEAVDLTDLRWLAQAALDSVPDLPEADPPQETAVGTQARALPDDLCAAVPVNLRDYLVPAVTSSRTGGTASGSTTSATCALANRQQVPEPALAADVDATVVAFGPELGLTAEQAAEAAFAESCLGDEPVVGDLGTEQCSRSSRNDDDATIAAFVVRDGSVLVDVTYVSRAVDPSVAAPADGARLVVEALLGAL